MDEFASSISELQFYIKNNSTSQKSTSGKSNVQSKYVHRWFDDIL